MLRFPSTSLAKDCIGERDPFHPWGRSKHSSTRIGSIDRGIPPRGWVEGAAYPQARESRRVLLAHWSNAPDGDPGGNTGTKLSIKRGLHRYFVSELSIRGRTDRYFGIEVSMMR